MLRVCLNCYGTYTTDSIYQWDLNQTLSITGLNVDDITAIHFCNKKCDTARVVNVTRDSEGVYAPIPNELLEEPYDVIAYVHTINDNQAKTIEIINIPVIKRVKPDDYVFVENVDIVNFERLEGDIADYIATMNNAFNDFTSSTNQNYQSFTSGVTQSQNDFESEFMTEYNERVNNGYFLGPDGATNIQERLTTLEDQIIDVDALNEASGSPILLTDSGENALTEIAIYGRSTQDGDPTPDNPIDIVSVGAGSTLEVKSIDKNILGCTNPNTTFTDNEITFTKNDDGSVTVNGTNNSDEIAEYHYKAYNDATYGLMQHLVNGEKYILSGCPSGGSKDGYSLTMCFRNGSTAVSSRMYDVGNGLEFENKYPDADRFQVVIYVKPGVTVNNLVFKPMIRRAEVGDGTYKPYTENTVSIPLTEPLRGIGDVRDEIACKDGVYGVIRRIASEVFTGDSSENWQKHGTQTNVYFRYFANSQRDVTTCMSSHFVANTIYPPIEGTIYNYTNTAKMIYKDVATLDEWLAWLQANPVTIDYVLAEEVFEPFDDQEVFKNIVTYNNVTYLTNTDNADMWVQYYTNSNIGQRLAKTNDELQLVKSTLGYSCKNILNHNLTSQTFGGLTFTVNDDKSIDIDGKVTTPGVVVLWGGILKAGSYILKGMEKVSSSIAKGFKMEIANYTTNEFIDYFPGETEKKLVFSVDSDIYISLNWNTLNTICSGTAYPMLRSAKYNDGTYEPGFGDVHTRLARVEKEPILTTPMEIPVGRLGPLSSLAVTALVPDIEGYTPLMSMYVRNTANGDKINVTAYENNNIITNNRTKVILNNETDQIFDDVKAHIIILYVRK